MVVSISERMFGATALLIAAAAAQGQAGRDLSRLLPIYAEPKAFVSQPGERIRLGAYMPPQERLEELVAMGVKLFVGETDRLRPIKAPGLTRSKPAPPKRRRRRKPALNGG